MILSDYLVNYLIEKNITDVFGIPGGVVLEFLYAINRRSNEINARLGFHEQCSVFSASGYARTTKKLGVAYATRGPGFTNMITSIADAYCDSIPILIITGHSEILPKKNMRVTFDQEIDTIKMVSNITKYAARIDDPQDFKYEVEKAYFEAMNGRKGPVLLDINIRVLPTDIDVKNSRSFTNEIKDNVYDQVDVGKIINEISNSKRPIFIIGDGVRETDVTSKLAKISDNFKIPILSSRFAQDLFSKYNTFFGYFGSHGLRYGNFILSKADLIISFGNRMIFPLDSPSYSGVLKNSRFIRVDIDASEFIREIPNSINLNLDLTKVINKLENKSLVYKDADKWLSVCNKIKNDLNEEDIGYPITALIKIFEEINQDQIIISDVGNNEFWLCRAYAYSGITNPIFFSKSFGAMGSSLGKAIGSYHGSGKPILCFIGDQSLQMNIQELHYLSYNKIPVAVILLNNYSSGMIRSREKVRYGENFLHTTLESGYSVPCFTSLAKAYGIKSYSFNEKDYYKINKILSHITDPLLIEIKIDPSIEMIPHIPKENSLQDMLPKIDDKKYKILNEL